MKKFIVTQDSAVASKLIASGVKLISHINGTYTFINSLPQKFAFDDADNKKVVYTNILSL